MKIIEVSIRNPLGTIMAFVATLFFGLLANYYLPRDIFPDIEFPTLTVMTVYPGAASQNVEEKVTKPLEAILSNTTHLKKIQSFSRENVSIISLQFDWGTDITEAAAEVRDLLEYVKNDLPDQAYSPLIMKINNSVFPVVILGIGAKENYDKIHELIKNRIIPELRRLDGVGTVLTVAEPTRVLEITLDQSKMARYRLTLSQIQTFLSLNNISIPAGSIKTSKWDISLEVPAEFESPEDIQNMLLPLPMGGSIRLNEVATIRWKYKEKDEITRTAGKRAVALMVQKQTDANTLEVFKNVMNALPQIQKNLPPDVTITQVFNTAEIVEQSLKNLGNTLLSGGILVVIVTWIFLRRWRSSLIVGLTIPFSLIVSYIVMYLLGYTVNVFTLMSLVIAIGMVVDNTIVVLENVIRHIDRGARPREAALFGTNEMSLAISASTFTTIVVLVPLMFAGGIVGVMFKQMAIITTTTLLTSLLVSITLSPTLISLMINPAYEQRKNRWFVRSEKWFQQLEKGYVWLLQKALNNKKWTWGVVFVLVLLSFLLAFNIGKDYIPNIDTGDIMIELRLDEGIRTDETEKLVAKIEQKLDSIVPEKVYAFSVIGQTERGILSSVGFKEGKNIAAIVLHLTSPDQRKRSSHEIAQVIREELKKYPQIQAFNVSGSSILATALLGNVKPIEVLIKGNDLDELSGIAKAIEDSLKRKAYLKNITNSASVSRPTYEVRINKEKALTYGLTPLMVAMQLRNAVYGAKTGVFKEKGKEYDIIVRFDSIVRSDPEELKKIYLSTPKGDAIMLSEIAEVQFGVSPIEIEHIGQERVVKVSADIEQGVSLSEAVRDVQQLLEPYKANPDVLVELSGQNVEQKESFSNLSLIFFIGMMLVYMIMVAQFKSLKAPFIILFTIPFALIGVIIAFSITNVNLNLVTFVGVIMLLGVVVNNGIVLVDYTNLLRARKYGLREAVVEAGRSRLRPVIMTSLTTVLGMFPMALSNGLASEIWSPLGITMIGGLLFSTLITLILMPVTYEIFFKKNK